MRAFADYPDISLHYAVSGSGSGGHIMVVQAPDAVAEKIRTFFLKQ